VRVDEAVRGTVVAATAVALCAVDLGAQDWCNDRGRGEVACETREYAFVSDGDLTIDGGMNGGVDVLGWEGNEVRVEARVRVRAESTSRADEILDQVDVRAGPASVEAHGPRTGRHEGWSVSYRISVPHDTDLDVETHNGGIDLMDVSGRIRLSALNGGVSVKGAGGDVTGRTTNGGVSVELSGDRWEGEGLDVQTTNGGVTVSIPDGYSAEFETATVNGGFSLDVPLTIQGRIGRHIRSTLGRGGAPVRVRTTNGGVRIVRGAG